MKTYYFSSRSIPVYSLMGMMALLLASCGSYKNSYDNDPAYSGNNRQDEKTTAADNHYKNYFDSLQDDSQVFTDVDNYNTTQTDSTQTDNKAYASDNGGWGSDSNTTVIVYDNNWGGYYNPWYYGSSWGFGYYGGWGWALDGVIARGIVTVAGVILIMEAITEVTMVVITHIIITIIMAVAAEETLTHTTADEAGLLTAI
ncbi:hypothetical protein [Flavobacterium sp. 3HN19-14]|uniref:hypothetical protein n=1 Tax=Flavobacterium sp. 3HN19-14 TaxID=3448133 RepID=UPI003EE22B36